MNQQINWNNHVKLGQIELSSRVVLTSLTRVRCDPQDSIPNDLMVEYYTQRAGAGLVLTECAAWSPQGQAFPGAGNIHTKEQAAGWKRVVDSVHKKGAKIFLQIFHAGRATHPQLIGNRQVLSSSPIANRDVFRAIPGQKYPIPKEMTLQDIKKTQQQFRKAILLSQEAGFDGVQLHGANGYLIDQFLRSETNKRTDNYGGSAQNRIRFCLDLIDIALEILKPYQVSIKLSPVSQYNDMMDNIPVQTYSLLLKELSKKNIGFVELKQSTQVNFTKSQYNITPPQQIPKVCKTLRPFFNGLIIANDSFTPQSGLEAIRNGEADLISFGRLYICNPDLAERILNKQQVNKSYDYKTFFTQGPVGYTDYPFYDEWIKTQPVQN